MSMTQYSSDFSYHSLMFEQQQQHNQNDIVSQKEPLFEKPLTPSDVGKLNRLVIPKQHAERYFPLSTTTAVEKGLLLCFEDEEGKPWRFRYSYWNSSQSYVLTKGWSRYVKEKQLDAGDVVLFHRHRGDCGRFFIGWRRRGESSNSSSDQSYRHVQSNASLQYYPHAGAQGVENQIRNSKTLRLFGVNMECQLDSDWSEPSTPDDPTTCQQHYTTWT